MKLKFDLKATLLFSLITLSSISVIVLSSLSFVAINKGNDFDKDTVSDYLDSTNRNKYIIEQGTLRDINNIPLTMVETTNLYSTYEVDNFEVNIGQEITSGQKLGTKSSSPVNSAFDGIVLTIEDTSSSKKITTYNYNQFKLQLSLSLSEYYSLNLDKQSSHTIKVDETDYNATFLGYDFSQLQDQKNVLANFSLNNNNKIILSSSTFTYSNITREFENVFYLPMNAFPQQMEVKNFLKIENDKFVVIEISSVAYVGDFVIIESLDALTKGMILYE